MAMSCSRLLLLMFCALFVIIIPHVTQDTAVQMTYNLLAMILINII